MPGSPFTTPRPSVTGSPRIEPAGPGQRSVWDFPRPPLMVSCDRHLRVEFAGRVIAETRRAVQVLETSHPPSYYSPPEDVVLNSLRSTGRHSLCEWKGRATAFDVVVDGQTAPAAAWAYLVPSTAGEILKDHIAFYAGRVDRCTVDGEQVRPQEGDFYGGWITSDIVGPFKGPPGTRGW